AAGASIAVPLLDRVLHATLGSVGVAEGPGAVGRVRQRLAQAHGAQREELAQGGAGGAGRQFGPLVRSGSRTAAAVELHDRLFDACGACEQPVQPVADDAWPVGLAEAQAGDAPGEDILDAAVHAYAVDIDFREHRAGPGIAAPL